jgi:mevalonate pyrophosphate decarboxylase
MPEASQDHCRSTAFSNILDWHSAAGFAPGSAGCKAIKATIVRAERANQSGVDVSTNIARLIEPSAPRDVDGAGHVLI